MDHTTKNEKNWISDAMFYHIYPLGLTGAPRRNEGETTKGSRILKILDWIPHLKNIGINAIYFGPVFESLTHGYDTSDYYETDSRLGTKDDFKTLFTALHDNGIRVIVDGVFNHCGRGFFAFQDLQQNKWDSKYKDWFADVNFLQQSAFGDPFSYATWQGNADLVKFNLRNPDVCSYLLGAVQMWMDELGIDGLRLDAADCVDMDFFKQLRANTKKIDPSFWLMGEIIHGDYARWANPEMLDSVTNYECWKGIYSSHNDKNYFEIAYSLNRQFGDYGIYKNLILYNFLDNHDVSRIRNLLNHTENLQNAYTILYTMPGVPSIYYGSEWGIEGQKQSGYDADVPLRPELDITDYIDSNQELVSHIKMLAQARTGSPAIRYGNYEQVLVKNEQLVYARTYESSIALVCLNLADHAEQLGFSFRGENYEVMLEAHTSKIITK